MIKQPVSVYINWASYDELSDNIELTEVIALRQLEELERLRRFGVRFDYYLMDAFWYARDGAYHTWRKPHWPDGPDRWLEGCRQAGVLPGLWVTANTLGLSRMECAPAWKDSLDEEAQALCCFYGGYLADFMAVLQEWYSRGIRAFKFDFANFLAAPRALRSVMTPSEIRSANVIAWQGAMKAFRRTHPDILLMGYNGFEEAPLQWGTSLPLVKGLDRRWLDVFDSLYCGDPRPADLPAMNFWRSKDIYSDHMVRVYELNDIPLSRIDNSAFMIGTTGTCYFRRIAAWKGMLILSLARGGFVNTYYGNLDLLGESQARWFARVQGWYMELQRHAEISSFGGMPGKGEAYGYCALRGRDGLLAVVNPGQLPVEMALPVAAGVSLRILFRDAGFEPELAGESIRLGPEQMALIGAGSYAEAMNDLGVQEDVLIPIESRLIAESTGSPNLRSISLRLENLPSLGHLRIVMRQADAGGPVRVSGGSPPNGTTLGEILLLRAKEEEREIPVQIAYDKAIWSGLSWAAGEVDCAALTPGQSLTVHGESKDVRPLTLTLSVYHVLGSE